MEDFFDLTPYIEFFTESTNGAIYSAVAGQKAVHLVDFGIWQGGQWPPLMERLARQPGGPPHLRITAVDCPGLVHPGKKHGTSSTAIGKHLSLTAASLGIPFEYRSVEYSLERFTSTNLDLRANEILAISCCNRLRNLYDASIMRSNPRDSALQVSFIAGLCFPKLILLVLLVFHFVNVFLFTFQQMRKLRPAVVAMAEMNLDSNGFFFMQRFKESLDFFFKTLESFDVSFPAGSPSMLSLERSIFARDIISIVACEGIQRVVRTERQDQWQERFIRAGFVPLEVQHCNVERLERILRRCERGFGVGINSNNTGITLEFKGSPLLCSSSWKPIY